MVTSDTTSIMLYVEDFFLRLGFTLYLTPSSLIPYLGFNFIMLLSSDAFLGFTGIHNFCLFTDGFTMH